MKRDQAVVRDHDEGVTLGLEHAPQGSNRKVDRPTHPFQPLACGESTSVAEGPLKRVGDQARVLVLVGARMVSKNEVGVLLGQHPLDHPVEVAVEPFALLEEGVEVDACREVEPPRRQLPPVGLSRPRADGLRETVLESLRVCAQAVGAAQIEPEGAFEAVDVEHLAPCAVAVRTVVAPPLRLEAELEPLHFSDIAPVGGVGEPHRRRVVSRSAIGLGVHQGEQDLDRIGRCRTEINLEAPQQRRQPVIRGNLAGGARGVGFQLEELGGGQRRPRPHRPEVPHPIRRLAVGPRPYEGCHRETVPSRGLPEGLGITRRGETRDPLADRGPGTAKPVADDAGAGRVMAGHQGGVVDRGQRRVDHPQPLRRETPFCQTAKPIRRGGRAVGNPPPRQVRSDPVEGDHHHPLGADLRRPTTLAGKGEREHDGGGKDREAKGRCFQHRGDGSATK